MGPASQAEAAEQETTAAPVIYATAWGYTLAQDGSGFYNEVAAALTQREGGRSHYKLMPYKRAKAHFKAHEDSCLYPSSIDVLSAGGLADKPETLIQSETLFDVSTHLFAQPGQRPPRTMADLKGKRIALPAGSVMMQLLKGSGAKLIGVNDEESKAEMLMSGRVQLMSGMLPDTSLVFTHMQRRLPAYDKGFGFLKVGLSVVCHDSRENRALIGRLNSRIAELGEDEGYRGLLARAGLTPARGAEQALNAIMPSGGRRQIHAPSGRRFPHYNRR